MRELVSPPGRLDRPAGDVREGGERLAIGRGAQRREERRQRRAALRPGLHRGEHAAAHRHVGDRAGDHAGRQRVERQRGHQRHALAGRRHRARDRGIRSCSVPSWLEPGERAHALDEPPAGRVGRRQDPAVRGEVGEPDGRTGRHGAQRLHEGSLLAEQLGAVERVGFAFGEEVVLVADRGVDGAEPDGVEALENSK